MCLSIIFSGYSRELLRCARFGQFFLCWRKSEIKGKKILHTCLVVTGVSLHENWKDKNRQKADNEMD